VTCGCGSTVGKLVDTVDVVGGGRSPGRIALRGRGGLSLGGMEVVGLGGGGRPSSFRLCTSSL